MTTDLRVLPGARALAAAVAAEVALVLAEAAGERGWASIALAGGNTPRALYAALAADHRNDVPWARLQVFWGDERDVPPNDEQSNYRMARETLLDAVAVPQLQVHPMPTGAGDPEAAAVAYERRLRRGFNGEWPTFDLVLLGLGEDGHTASLFPRSPALAERVRWVVPSLAPVEPRQRLTLTLPALTHAHRIFLVASGRAKAEPLRRALTGAPGPDCPASMLRSGSAPVTWWADAAAAPASPGAD
jgi:6-phosphogluconolactonase